MGPVCLWLAWVADCGRFINRGPDRLVHASVVLRVRKGRKFIFALVVALVHRLGLAENTAG